MDVSLEKHGEYLFIRSVDAGGVRIGEACYTNSIIVTPRQVTGDWGPADMADLTRSHLDMLVDLQPEVALLGTGATQHFLPRELMIHVIRSGIGLEVMTTDAACRTYNVLAADGRRVAAALLPMGPLSN